MEYKKRELKEYLECAKAVNTHGVAGMLKMENRTDAPEVLAAMEGKKAVVLAGVTAECCVLATMMDAMDLGYEVVYLYDCIAGQSAELEAQVRGIAEMFEPTQITVMSSAEYLTAISGA